MSTIRPIEVVEYDPSWPAQFDELREHIWPSVSDLAIAIEHVGSTSVPGLAAKPIIDMDIVIPTRDALPEVIKRLAALGYAYQGDFGIVDRESFRRPEGTVRHHLYVCPLSSTALNNHLTLRNHLHSYPADRDVYARMKSDLAEKFPADIDAYTIGKTKFIVSILAQYDFSADAIGAIKQANLHL